MYGTEYKLTTMVQFPNTAPLEKTGKESPLVSLIKSLAKTLSRLTIEYNNKEIAKNVLTEINYMINA